MESPVAWPSYKGFPPDRDPVTKKAIDYALKPHGGRFVLTVTVTLALAFCAIFLRKGLDCLGVPSELFVKRTLIADA